MTKILVTGANGHLGRRLIRTLDSEQEIIALVRSERARERLAQETSSRSNVSIVVGDPGHQLARLICQSALGKG